MALSTLSRPSGTAGPVIQALDSGRLGKQTLRRAQRRDCGRQRGCCSLSARRSWRRPCGPSAPGRRPKRLEHTGAGIGRRHSGKPAARRSPTRWCRQAQERAVERSKPSPLVEDLGFTTWPDKLQRRSELGVSRPPTIDSCFRFKRSFRGGRAEGAALPRNS
jgi:hypothetical protein